MEITEISESPQLIHFNKEDPTMARWFTPIIWTTLAYCAIATDDASACHRFCTICRSFQPCCQPIPSSFGMPSQYGSVPPAPTTVGDSTMDIHIPADVTQRPKSYLLSAGITSGKASPAGAPSPSFTCYQYTYYITGDSGFAPTTWSTLARSDVEATNFTNAHLAALGQQYHTSLHAQFRGKTGPFQCN
jgi:hypothetical protein